MTEVLQRAPEAGRIFDDEWDLVVIGGGTAGLVGARTAAGLGARVLLVERNRLGGECLWSGCVPSKALLAAARAAAAPKQRPLGVLVTTQVDYALVRRHVQEAIRTIAPHDSAESLHADGVSVLHADVRFTGPRTLATAEGHVVRFRQALIATGSEPSRLPIAGDPLDPVTNENVWDLEALPSRLAVVGGGAVASELAQAFARLGSAVTVLQRGPRLLSKEHEDAARIVTAALVADGVEVRCGTSIDHVQSSDGRSGVLRLADGSSVPFDRVLMAVGRRSRVAGLGLDAAGVEVDDRGDVVVDERLRTRNPRVRAAGDVTPLPRFTHTAGVNASTAAMDAVLGLRRRVDPVVPRVTYTDPELAAVGVQDGDTGGHRVVTIEHREIDRAIVESDTAGFTRLVLDRRGVVVGGTIVGPRAGESLAEITLAVRHRLTASAVAATTHPYPTFNDGVWNAAIADVRQRLGRGAARSAIRALVAVRRIRLR